MGTAILCRMVPRTLYPCPTPSTLYRSINCIIRREIVKNPDKNAKGCGGSGGVLWIQVIYFDQKKMFFIGDKSQSMSVRGKNQSTPSDPPTRFMH
jgi:hypothetical protein